MTLAKPAKPRKYYALKKRPCLITSSVHTKAMHAIVNQNKVRICKIRFMPDLGSSSSVVAPDVDLAQGAPDVDLAQGAPARETSEGPSREKTPLCG